MKKSIDQVLRENTDTLMSIDGVLGTAQGQLAGKPCIKVFVVKKSSQLIQQIPATIDGYIVSIQETGNIQALG